MMAANFPSVEPLWPLHYPHIMCFRIYSVEHSDFSKIISLFAKNKINMAKQIRNTAILYGKDAKQFLAEIENLPTPEERKRERARIDAEVNYFLAEIEKMKNKQM